MNNENLFTHRYSLAAIGVKMKTQEYTSRQMAMSAMYKYCNKKGLKITSIWDDKHFKTYNCDNGIKFFINRVY